MRYALSEFFARSPMLVFPVIALVLFAGVFAIVLVRTLRRHERHYGDIARLPLEAEEAEHHE